MTAAPPPLAPDLAAGLRRLKLAAMRQLAPELLITAKTQRWAPEELLRTLIDAELAARDASNARTRMKNAAFPVVKTLDELDRSVSSIPGPTLDYLASLEWVAAPENLCLVGRHRQEPRPGRPRRRRRPGWAQGPVLHRR
jgi:DNA replication protein DnaC